MSTQNPFGEPGGSYNPYAAPGPTSYYGPAANYRPHRGGLVLTLGIVGIVFSTMGAAFCIVVPIFGLAVSIPAWMMGAADLKAINRGEMDPQGKGATTAGMITGIVGTVIGGLVALICLALAVFFVGMLIFAGAASNMK